MAIETKIGRKLDNNSIQVDVVYPKNYTRHFKVPQNKADEFCTNFKDGAKKADYITTGSLLVAVPAACALAGMFTKNLSKALKMTVGVFCGVGAVLASTLASTKIIQTREHKLLENHNSREIFYPKNKLPI